MRITIDLDAEKAVLGPGTTQELASLAFKRATLAVLEVQFVRGITVTELDSGATGKFEAKHTGHYDSNEAITGAAAWTKFGTGTSTYYRFAFALINNALNLLFGVETPAACTATAATDLINATAHGLVANDIVEFSTDDTLPAPLSIGTDYYVIAGGLTADVFKVSLTLGGTAVNITDTGTGNHEFVKVNNDIASITLMSEVSWTEFGLNHKTQTLALVVANDVNRDDDVIPGSPAIVYYRSSFLRHGSGVPVDAVGVDGDGYINDDTGDLYFRASGVYVLDFNINGADSGFSYKFNTATSGDPGSGKFLFNNATFASATQFNVSETDNMSNSLAAFLALQDDSTSANKCLVVARKQDGTPCFLFWITAALTDAGSYDTFPITPISTAGSIANNDVFRLSFYRTGDKGDTGTTGTTGTAGATTSVTQNYSTTTTDSDPGSGIFRFNNTTIASVTAAYLDNNEAGGNSITALLDSFDDSTSTLKGFLVFRGVTAPTAFAIFSVSGSVADGTGYRKLTLTYISSGGTFTNGNLFAFAFYRTGNIGTAGVDGGTTYDAPVAISSGATPTVDLTTTAMSTLRLLATNTTITFSNPVAGKTSILHFKQAAASSYTVDMPDIDHWVGTGGGQPVMSAAFNAVDAYTVWYDGTDYYASWAPGV